MDRGKIDDRACGLMSRLHGFIRTNWLCLLAALVLCFGQASAFAAENPKTLKGIALVIGNGDYEHIAKLANPPNDARAVEEMLAGLGFDTDVVSDRDARRLRRALDGFVEDAEGADVAVIYYSGHGIEAGGENFLVPVDADLSALDDAGEKLVPLSGIIDELKRAVPVTIVLLDACRTSPFPPGAQVKVAPDAPAAPVGSGGLGAARGAVSIAATATRQDNFGTVIGFAAEPGHVALDGDPGANSPYAAAILRHLSAMEGAEFGTVMRMVAEEVYLKTSGRQRPWVNESLSRLLYFGTPAPLPEGEDGGILGERRQLLLTIAALPEPGRRQIETLAKAGDVPMDALYAMLKALGTDTPQDPAELDRLLRGQTERLKTMLAERATLDSVDPEIARLSARADRALREGALSAAIKALDDAKARVADLGATVDKAESELAAKRREFAAVFARSGEANALAWDQLKAADDYRQAFKQIEKWDTALAWEYRFREADALLAYGDRKADRPVLLSALDAATATLALAEDVEQRARSIQAIAAIDYTLGTRESGTVRLERAADGFRQAVAAWSPDTQPRQWSDAQNGLGNALWALGERDVGTERLEEAAAAYRAALSKASRADAPFLWAQAENNLGNVVSALGQREASIPRLNEAVSAYDASLEVMTFEAAPAFFGTVQNNRGKALLAIGQLEQGTASLEQALTAFDLAIKGSPRDLFPLRWATIHVNAGIVLEALAARQADDPDFAADLRHQATAAFDNALQAMAGDGAVLQRALTEHNYAITLQGLSQAAPDQATRRKLLEDAATRQRGALAAMTATGEPALRARMSVAFAQTLQMLAQDSDAAAPALEEAATQYREALKLVGRKQSPQLWASYQAELARLLQLLAESVGVPGEAASYAREAATRQAELIADYGARGETAAWADALHDLAYSQIQLGSLGEASAYREAEASYRQEMTVRSKETDPVAWAKAQAGIGNALRGIGLSIRDKATLTEARQRTAEARAAIQPFDTAYNPVLDARLAEIDAALANLQ